MSGLRLLLSACLVVLAFGAGARAEQGAAPEPRADAAEGAEEGGEEKVYLDADGFRALFEGKTIHLSADGRYFGSEYYKKGDRSVWVQIGRPCMPGVWYYDKPYICFRYDATGTHCWTVFRRGENFFATSVEGFELRIDAVDEKPLSCAPELLS